MAKLIKDNVSLTINDPLKIKEYKQTYGYKEVGEDGQVMDDDKTISGEEYSKVLKDHKAAMDSNDELKKQLTDLQAEFEAVQDKLQETSHRGDDLIAEVDKLKDQLKEATKKTPSK